MSTTTRLLELAAEHFSVALGELAADDDFYDRLGIDSLQALEFLSELEMEFDVEIPDYELQGVRTFRALAEQIDKRR
ncbi:MAG: acyl carrier protein [Myxococcales bacterium]|nr:acyl carrier protein [Myxococcales bacterium]